MHNHDKYCIKHLYNLHAPYHEDPVCYGPRDITQTPEVGLHVNRRLTTDPTNGPYLSMVIGHTLSY